MLLRVTVRDVSMARDRLISIERSGCTIDADRRNRSAVSTVRAARSVKSDL